MRTPVPSLEVIADVLRAGQEALDQLHDALRSVQSRIDYSRRLLGDTRRFFAGERARAPSDWKESHDESFRAV